MDIGERETFVDGFADCGGGSDGGSLWSLSSATMAVGVVGFDKGSRDVGFRLQSPYEIFLLTCTCTHCILVHHHEQSK